MGGKEIGVRKMRKARKRHRQGQGQVKTDRETQEGETERLKDRET